MNESDSPEVVRSSDGLGLLPEREEAATDWYHGMTQKHYDLALWKAVAAERERCSRCAETLTIIPGETAVEFSKRLAAAMREA